MTLSRPSSTALPMASPLRVAPLLATVLSLFLALSACSHTASAPAPADPTPTEQPSVAPPDPMALFSDRPLVTEFFAMNAITPFHHKHSDDPRVTAQLWETMRRQLATARDMGARSIRLDMWWGSIETEKGKYEWEFPDRVIDEIVAAGLEPYPILCYNPVWRPDVSPRDDSMRAEFAMYARQLVLRYKDRIKNWEVWNEPNTDFFWSPAPSPTDYAALLRVVYTTIKSADPEAKVVGMCTAGADYAFIEEVLQAGAADHFDILSYHHYNSLYDESVMEGEIRRIRQIMNQYGVADRPIIITEFGHTTGPSPVVAQSTPREQAEWIIKKHLIAQAEGIERLYYFKMADDPPANEPDGLWGLLDSSYAEKPSGTAYRVMTRRLAGARFIGRAWRMMPSPIRRDDVEFQVFLAQDGEVFAVAWVRADGESALIKVPADTPITPVNMTGIPSQSLAPGEDGMVMIQLTHEPVYLPGLSLSVLALASVTFDPPAVHLAPGEEQQVALRAVNPTAAPLMLRLEPFIWPRKNQLVTVATEQDSVPLAPGESARIPIRLSLPTDAVEFRHETYAFNDLLRYTYRLPVYFQQPFLLSLHAQPQIDMVTVQGELTGFAIPWQQLDVNWSINNGDQIYTEVLSPPTSGRLRPLSRGIPITGGETRVQLRVTTEKGVGIEGHYHIYQMPFARTDISIDNPDTDWGNVAPLRIEPPAQQIRPQPAVATLAADEFSATVRLMSSEFNLYIHAEINDSTPARNSNLNGEIWRGDAIELYLGINGPTRLPQYTPAHFHIGLSPGNPEVGITPSAWLWAGAGGGSAISGARILVTTTETGYILKASIPFGSLGIELPEGHAFGLDVQINDGGANPAAREARSVLAWNGTDQNWRDPSNWGFGKVEGRASEGGGFEVEKEMNEE